MPKYRSHLLLDPEQHETALKRRLQAIEKARWVRTSILQKLEDTPLTVNISDLISDTRQERDENIYGSSD
jgi:hypothetical protein